MFARALCNYIRLTHHAANSMRSGDGGGALEMGDGGRCNHRVLYCITKLEED